MKQQSNLSKWLQQLFCNHKYSIPTEYDDQEERDKLVSELKKGESIAFSLLHRCEKCNKEQVIGSGMHC